MSETPRTAIARDHDDSAVIDDADGGDGIVGRSGGNLACDLAAGDALKRDVTDPDGHTRATKQDDIDNDVATPNQRAR